MGKKVSALLTGLVSFTFSAAAQPAVNNRSLEFLAGFLNGFMQSYVGVPITETNLLPTLMIIGAYYLAFYFALEAFLDKLGWLSRLQSGRTGQESNRRLVVLSLLIFVAFMGSQLFTPLILIARDSIFLLIAVMSVVALLGIIQGGYFFSRGAGTSAKAGGKEYLNDAKNRLQEAEQLTSQAEQEEQESEQRRESGDTSTGDQEARDAASKMEQAIQDIEQVLEDIEAIEGKDESEIKNIVQQAEAVKAGSGLGPERDFENRVQELNQAVQIVQGTVSTGGDASMVQNQINAAGYFSSFPDMEDSIRTLYEDLEAFANAESNAESTMETELEELVDVVQDFEAVKSLFDELSQEMHQAKEAENFEEELARQYGDEELYEKVEVEESQVRQLGEELEQLEEKHANLESEIEQAVNLMKEQLDLEDSELEELERIRNNIINPESGPGLRNNLQQSINAIESSPINPDPSGPSSPEAVELWNMLQALDPDKIENLMVQIEQRMQGSEDSLRGRLNDLLSNFP